MGAGIGGLAAGLALKRAGWQISIHERSASPRELGFGLLLAPNALSALAELGVADRIVRPDITAAGVEVRTLNGRVIRKFKAQPGGPALVALRPNLYGALLDSVGNDALTLGSDVAGFSENSDSVTLRLKGGGSESGDILIGADGVNSAIRKQMHPNEPPPRPSGYCALRGVALGLTGQLSGLTAVSYLDHGIEAAMARAGTDAVYWYMSLLSDDIDRADRTPGGILATRLAQLDTPLRAVVSGTTADDMRFDELFVRDPLTAWGSGRVTLLGDAAHPMLPHTGQGAAQALEDAVALGLALRHAGPFEDLLRQYEKVRLRHTSSFVKLGPILARVTTTRSRMIQRLRTSAIRLIPESLFGETRASARRDPHRDLR